MRTTRSNIDQNISCNRDHIRKEKMYKLWKTLVVTFIIQGSCFIPSNSVGANLQSGHRRHCSNQFCIDKNYEKLELPPPNNGSTVQVVITPHILEIFDVSFNTFRNTNNNNPNDNVHHECMKRINIDCQCQWNSIDYLLVPFASCVLSVLLIV